LALVTDDTPKSSFGRTSRYAAEYNPPERLDTPPEGTPAADKAPFAGIDPSDLIYDE
jgi:hypothetical protein